MLKNGASTPVQPTRATRRLASLLIILHFLAILTAVTSASSANFPAPALAVLANRPFQPYLQATFLANAYRFYAPDPGAPSVLWFRIQYQDRSVRWLELPRRADFHLRMSYERCKSLAGLLSQQVTPGPNGQLEISDLGQIGLASYVRHLASTRQRTTPDGSVLTVRSIGVYTVQHAARQPEQIREGWEPNDLRTYRAAFLGAYNPAGLRTDEYRPGAVEQPIAFVAAGIVAVDVWPLPKATEPGDRQLDELELPRPIRRLLARFPELLSPTIRQAELQKHIEQLVIGPTAL